jgi:methylthioribose-1-phosphate isomerase
MSQAVSVRWVGDIDGHFELLDQTQLPLLVEVLSIRDVAHLFESIVALRVRGAPAIGIAAAYGVVLSAQSAISLPLADAIVQIERDCDYLATSRPTAVNLFWALDRMKRLVQRFVSAITSRSKAHPR